MVVSQKNLMVGNIIDVMGTIQIVMGLVFREEQKDWFIQHTGRESEGIPIPEGIEVNANGIMATDPWKVFLKVDKREFPKHIKYVHEIQNYCLLNYEVRLTEDIDWNKIPTLEWTESDI